MIDEFALTPDVFLSSGYSKPDYKDVCLPFLRTALLGEATLVRDLGGGAFMRRCLSMGKEASELVRKLASRNKLHQDLLRTKLEEDAPCSWCAEALASHRMSPLTGIVTSHAVKADHRKNGLVAAAEKLDSTAWWQLRRTSFDTGRNIVTYLEHLRPLLNQANSLMFIDPNLDPSQGNYRDFHELISPTAPRNPPPLIEIHRSVRRGDGPDAKVLTKEQWRESFEGLHRRLVEWKLLACVFFWVDFHHRFLISDLAGYQVDQGFDVTKAPDSSNAWTRLDRDGREEKQRHYDPNSRPGAYKFSFPIGQAR